MRIAAWVLAVLVATGQGVAAQEVCTARNEEAAEAFVRTGNTDRAKAYGVTDVIRWNRNAAGTWYSVLVHPRFWNDPSMDLDMKHLTTRTLGIWVNCIVVPHERKLEKNDRATVEIVDMMSGKKLASIGLFRGFRIEGE